MEISLKCGETMKNVDLTMEKYGDLTIEQYGLKTMFRTEIFQE